MRNTSAILAAFAIVIISVPGLADDSPCVPECGASQICVNGECRTRFSSVGQTAKRGLVEVATTPDGAVVRIDGRVEGRTPLTVETTAGTHKISVSMEGHDTVVDRVTVSAGQTAERQYALDLTRRYPMNPYKKAGHGLFWSGVALVVFGGIATYETGLNADAIRSGDWSADTAFSLWKTSSIIGYAIGGAAILSGIIVWAIDPGDKAWWRKHHASVDVAPRDNGAVVTVGARW